MATLTHIETLKTADANDMQTICQLLNWSVEQYCEHQFLNYLAFLKRRFHGQPIQALNRVMYSKTIRGFFNNEWSKRNHNDYLPFALDSNEHSQSNVCSKGTLYICWDYTAFQDFLIDEYMYVHNPAMLINDRDFLTRFNNTLNIL